MDKTWEFIRQHREEDVRVLALRSTPAILERRDVDMPFALQQIAGWQAARTKLPSWAATEGILYPKHLSMEQCSSEVTAEYKARIRAPHQLPRGGGLEQKVSPRGDLEGAWSVVDLTGGLGVDFVALARGASKAVYVEREEELCRLARNNFPLLGIQAEVVCGDAEEYLHQMEHTDLLLIDPARRDGAGRKMVGIGDCTPDVLRLKDEMLRKADTVMIKLSPMLDWHKAVDDLGDCVSEVHIVSVKNECKELIVVIRGERRKATGRRALLGNEERGARLLYCVNDDDEILEVVISANEQLVAPINHQLSAISNLYEPNASIMKSGCFAELCKKYGVMQIGQNSNLFVADRRIDNFPGRKFEVEAVSTMNKREVKELLRGERREERLRVGEQSSGMKGERKVLSKGERRANVAVRNFPMSAEQLRKRLKIADGGDTFIFGTTVADGTHSLIMCKKC